MSARRTFSDGYMVRMIESFLASKPTDHMLGLKVRLLFEERDRQGQGVIELPDEEN